jgi:hypothetical protein
MYCYISLLQSNIKRGNACGTVSFYLMMSNYEFTFQYYVDPV